MPGYASVTVSLKPEGGAPGRRFGRADGRSGRSGGKIFIFGELRISHEQNVVLPHVAIADLKPLHSTLWSKPSLATGNIGTITDMITCPGLDYCALANARSIPVAQDLSRRFADPERQKQIGPLKVKISGCINACGHHHVGHIGILGVEKKGTELYQITIGGDATETASIGTILGPGFTAEALPGAVETLVDTYLDLRAAPEESFVAAHRRLGDAPFKEALYGSR